MFVLFLLILIVLLIMSNFVSYKDRSNSIEVIHHLSTAHPTPYVIRKLVTFCNQHFKCNFSSKFDPTFTSEYFLDKSFFYLCDHKHKAILGILVYTEIISPINYFYISLLCIHQNMRKLGHVKKLVQALQYSNKVAKKKAVFCLDHYVYKDKIPTLPSPSFLLTQKDVVWIFLDKSSSHQFRMKSRSPVVSTLTLMSYQKQTGDTIYYQRLPLSYEECKYVYSLEYVVSSSQRVQEHEFNLSTFLHLPCIITVQKTDLSNTNTFTSHAFSKDYVYLHDPTKSTLSTSTLYQKIETNVFFLPL